MKPEEYFGLWNIVIPIASIPKSLNTVAKPTCPELKNVFRAFKVCPYDNLKVVVIGQDSYPDMKHGKPVATGIAFGNSKDTPECEYSPSLATLMKSFIDFSVPHYHITFDPSLEDISRQGVLFINAALTCEAGKPGSHMLLWRPFITTFLRNLSKYNTGIVYVLLGSEAQGLKTYIDEKHNYVLTDKHPAFYARTKTSMPSNIWKSVNDIIISINGKHEEIKWFQEETFSEGQCKEDEEQESEECNSVDL